MPSIRSADRWRVAGVTCAYTSAVVLMVETEGKGDHDQLLAILEHQCRERVARVEGW
jgi:hypothetical protein